MRQPNNNPEIFMPYIYQADLYCNKCGEAIIADICKKEPRMVPENQYDQSTYDSEDFPKFMIDCGESDSPCHCGNHEYCLEAETLPSGRKIGSFLMNGLTEYGEEWIAEQHTDNPNEVTQFWVDYYSSNGNYYPKIESLTKDQDDHN